MGRGRDAYNPGLAAAECQAVNAVHYGAPEELEGVGVGGQGEDADLGVACLGLQQEGPAGNRQIASRHLLGGGAQVLLHVKIVY